MAAYKMVVAYDGTDYYGWQKQEDHYPTIMQVLQDTFKHVFGQEVSIVGASRTDAGVHALGQVALFNTAMNISPERLRHAWNNLLPPAITIRSLEYAPDDFHPQHNVLQKTYHYDFFQQRPLPFLSRYGWYVRKPVNLDTLKAGLQVFVGTHDFRAFCTLEGQERETVRTIDSIDVVHVPNINAYRIVVRGHSFLHYMIRRIVGACITVASHEHLSVNDLQKALESKDPRQTLPKAQANGLCLYEIVYAQ